MRAAAVIARNWPFANGSGRILDKWAKGVDVGSGEQIAHTSDGFPLHVYADDLIGRHILMSGKFDRSIVQVLLQQARPGDVLCDIGANIGYISACFLHAVPDGKAICIDPQPGVVELLRKNMRQFGKRAKVLKTALGDATGELKFKINTTNRGKSRVSDAGTINVPQTRGADLFASFEKLDLLKIDVEGFELPIFRSISKELQRLKPRAILFEDHTGAAAPNGAIGSLLPDYKILGIDKRLLKTHLRPIHGRDDCRFNDYVALRS